MTSSPSAALPDVYIALFRGINVGGRNRVSMALLQTVFDTLGLPVIQTILQTGNVIFHLPSELTTPFQNTDHLAQAIQQQFEKTVGFVSEVFVLSALELETVMSRNPLLASCSPASWNYLMGILLKTEPEKERMQKFLAEWDAAPANQQEIIQQVGCVLYIYYAQGMGQSKLTTPLLERKLKIPMTARNWNTWQKIEQGVCNATETVKA